MNSTVLGHASARAAWSGGSSVISCGSRPGVGAGAGIRGSGRRRGTPGSCGRMGRRAHAGASTLPLPCLPTATLDPPLR